MLDNKCKICDFNLSKDNFSNSNYCINCFLFFVKKNIECHNCNKKITLCTFSKYLSCKKCYYRKKKSFRLNKYAFIDSEDS